MKKTTITHSNYKLISAIYQVIKERDIMKEFEKALHSKTAYEPRRYIQMKFKTRSYDTGEPLFEVAKDFFNIAISWDSTPDVNHRAWGEMHYELKDRINEIEREWNTEQVRKYKEEGYIRNPITREWYKPEPVLFRNYETCDDFHGTYQVTMRRGNGDEGYFDEGSPIMESSGDRRLL